MSLLHDNFYEGDVGREDLFDNILSFFDKISQNRQMDGHRHDHKRHMFIQSLFHAVKTGFSFFNRDYFQTISVIDVCNKNPTETDFKDKYNAIFQIPKLVSAVEIIQKTTDEIFQRIEMLSDVKAGTFYSPNDKYRSLTIHRTRAVESARTQMAAEEHFDFLTANVLLYNYNDGFKIYENGTWKNITSPKRPMLFFNLGVKFMNIKFIIRCNIIPYVICQT